MLDHQVSQPVRVVSDVPGRPFLIVAVSQLAEVRTVLDLHRWRHSIEKSAGESFAVVIELGDGVDPAAVQSALDAAP